MLVTELNWNMVVAYVMRRFRFFRPWYVETATPIPKDIVVVLDRSGTMSLGQSMTMAKDAAKTVVGTLNPKDRVCDWSTN